MLCVVYNFMARPGHMKYINPFLFFLWKLCRVKENAQAHRIW